MTFEEILPYVEIASFLIGAIGLFVLAYQIGKWRQKAETDMEDVKRKLDALSTKIDKVPQEFGPIFIDLYKMWEKLKENPEASKKRRPKDD
jgi:uncharacterized membrane-anchored protein YhcB (DUF1043 family)